ncbi:hypothetical protein ACA910_014007 [Epithemia clementina (nom. ined.)]
MDRKSLVLLLQSNLLLFLSSECHSLVQIRQPPLRMLGVSPPSSRGWISGQMFAEDDDDDNDPTSSNDQSNPLPNQSKSSTAAPTTAITIDFVNQTAVGPNEDDDDSSRDSGSVQILLRQAQALREEALSLERALNQSKIEKAQKEEEKVDQWIQELLFVTTATTFSQSESTTTMTKTELLNTVDRAFERLRDERFSQEQVNKIFRRICSQQKQSRSNHSPVMALLLDAVGKLDDLDRPDNPNKRWSGRVEQALQRKLFAMDWNIELEDDDDDSSSMDGRKPWRLW